MNLPGILQPKSADEAKTRSSRSVLSDRRLWALTTIGFVVFVLLFWLPFGFKTTGLMEEWMIIHDWEVGGQSPQGQDVGLFVTTGTLVVRPMDTTWFILTHAATPDSFLAFNLYTITAFILKGLLLCAILRKLLPNNPLFAVGVGLLFIIFPADDGLFTFRGMNIHTAVCLYLFGVYMLLSYYEKPHVLKVIAMWASLTVCLFTYELAHPLIALTPFLLLWKERRLSRQIVRVAILWWVAPMFAFSYEAYMFTREETYQSWVLARSGLNQPSVVGEIANSILVAYRRHFVDGWIIAFQGISLTSPLILFALGAGATATATLGAHLRAARNSAPAPARHYIELFVIGFAIIFLGYIVYMITPYRQLTWRMYYFSGIGGAICIGSLAFLASRLLRRWNAAFIVIMAALITLAAVRAVNQHQYYVTLSEQQQQLLRGVVRAVPKLQPSATLVVVDETGRYRDNWSLGTSYLLEDALTYLYNDYSLHAVLCSFNPQSDTFESLPELHEQCQFGSEAIGLSEDGKAVESVSYKDVVVVRFAGDGATLLQSIPADYLGEGGGESYNPAPLVDLSAAPPYRSGTLFSITD